MIPARNEGAYLAATVQAVRDTVAGAQIIVVDDGSTDGCAEALAAGPQDGLTLVRATGLGSPGARNHGAALATGEVLVFLDAHMGLPPGWLEPLLDEAVRPGIGAVAPGVAVMGAATSRGYGLRFVSPTFGVDWLPPQAEPFAVPILPGCAFLIRRDLFVAIGGFDDGIVAWGCEDAELTLRLWLLGHEQRVHPGVVVEHLFRMRHPYALPWDIVLHNQLRLASIHFGEARLGRVMEAMRGQAGFATALARLLAGDAAFRRRELAVRRTRDDDWYFDRFGEIA